MRLPILVLHISAGIVAVLSGAVTMSFRKGSRGHVLSGNVFVISMLVMAAGAVYLAIRKPPVTNITGGPLTFYLEGTAWATARRNNKDDNQTNAARIFDYSALLAALAIGAGQM